MADWGAGLSHLGCPHVQDTLQQAVCGLGGMLCMKSSRAVALWWDLILSGLFLAYETSCVCSCRIQFGVGLFSQKQVMG